MTGERAGQPVLAAFLVGLGSAWNGGNVGPAVGSLSAEFDVSLAAVGLLSGTVFFGAIVAASFVAPPVAERIGVTASLRWSCVLCAAGNVIFAVGPSFAVLAAGRIVVGLGLGLAFILAPVFAHGHGGVRSVGILGASIQLGIAGGSWPGASSRTRASTGGSRLGCRRSSAPRGGRSCHRGSRWRGRGRVRGVWSAPSFGTPTSGGSRCSSSPHSPSRWSSVPGSSTIWD